MPVRILVINGGGSAGYAAARLLSHIQDEMFVPWDSLFDMVVGVSTGSLIASAIAHKNMRADDIAKQYKNSLPKIFKYSWKWKWLSELKAIFFGTVYDSKNLQKELEKLFGDQQFGDVQQRILCMTLATKISPRQAPCHWKSWIKDGRNDTDKVRNVLCASCSAMYYFKPHCIRDEWFVDGGIVANNPTMHAWIEAKFNLQANAPIKIMNIACLDYDWGIPSPRKLGSLFSWRKNLASLFTVSGEASTVYQAHRAVNSSGKETVEKNLGPENYLEIPLGITSGMTSVSDKDFGYMDGRAARVWEIYKPAILRFFEGVVPNENLRNGDSDGYRPQSVPSLPT